MVAMNVWPTDAADGSVANEARWRKMARGFQTSGVVDNIGGALAPSLTMPNLTVAAGAAWVDGHYCELLGSQVLTATANGIAVVRFDPAANSAELLWRDGATVPTRTAGGVWEVLIAQVTGGVLADLRTIVGPSSVTAVSINGLMASEATAGTIGYVAGTGALWRRLASGWSRVTAEGNYGAGPGGNYPAAAAVVTVTVPADYMNRLLTFQYQALMTNHGPAFNDIALKVDGGVFSQFRMQVALNGNSEMVNLGVTGYLIPAGSPRTVTVCAGQYTIGLPADITFNHYSWQVVPL